MLRSAYTARRKFAWSGLRREVAVQRRALRCQLAVGVSIILRVQRPEAGIRGAHEREKAAVNLWSCGDVVGKVSPNTPVDFNT
jgi:hypothetical protein